MQMLHWLFSVKLSVFNCQKGWFYGYVWLISVLPFPSTLKYKYFSHELNYTRTCLLLNYIVKNKHQMFFVSVFNYLNEFSLAQERQENVQKIVLEGTERMEDQVRLHTVKHCQTHGVSVSLGLLVLRPWGQISLSEWARKWTEPLWKCVELTW